MIFINMGRSGRAPPLTACAVPQTLRGSSMGLCPYAPRNRVGACAPCPNLFEDLDYWSGRTFFCLSNTQVGVYSEGFAYLYNVVVVVKATSVVASYGVYATPAPCVRAKRLGVVLIPLSGFINLCVDKCNCHFKICHFLDALPGLGVLFVLWCFTWNSLNISLFHVTKVQKISEICKKKDLRFCLNYHLTHWFSVGYSVAILYFPPLGVFFRVHQWSQPPPTKIKIPKIQFIPK